MRDINKVFLVGRLGLDPEIRMTAAGKLVGKLRLATNRPVREGEGWGEATDWHTVTVFDWMAKRAQNHLHKGDGVAVEGNLRTRKWTDKEGRERFSTEVISRELNIFPRRDRHPAQTAATPPSAETTAAAEAEIPF